jgi:tetratricopeptide (TPR) repeat protein
MSARGLLVLSVVSLLIAGACSADPQARKVRYLASGDKYLEAGKLPEAIIEYRNAVQQDPRAGDAHVKLADAYLRSGDAGRALDEYTRAADLLPEDSSVHLKASGILLLAQRFDDAKLWAEKVLAREPSNLQAVIVVANALAGLKDFDAAVSEIEEAIKLNPGRGETYTNLGAVELGRGQKEAAERAFKRAVAIDGRSADGRLALANFYWADARWPAAEEEFRTVVQLDPANVLAHRALASFYIATNRAAEAEPHLKQVRDLTKEPAAEFALADYYVARKDDVSARGLLEKLAGTAATAPFAEVRLATLDRQSGLKEAAYQRVAKALATDRTNLPALLAKTTFLAADGRLEEALSAASLAVETHQDSAAALFALGTVQAARHQKEAAIAAYDGVLRLNPRATDAKVALARLHLSAGRAETSLDLAQDAAASQPENLNARLAVARALLARRELPKAQVELDSLERQIPDSAALQTLLGVLKGLQQDQAGARRSFERALELDANSIEALGGLVVLDLNAKRTSEALARVDERVARKPDTAALMLAARVYARAGRPQQVESLLRRVIETDPGALEAYGALAQFYVSEKRLDAALKEFEELARREPRPVAALTFAGMILQDQGRTTEARDRFVRALELDPDAPVAANNLAWLYAESGDDIDLALDLALRALGKLSDRPEVNDTVGWVHYKKGLAPEAILYFQKSIQRDANNSLYHYHLGLAYVKSGDVSRGRQAMERALGLNPDFQGAAEAKQMLARLAASDGR